MKINKKFLQRIIKEEIGKAVEEESLKREIIQCYVAAISANNNNFPDKNEPEKVLYKELKGLGIDPLDALPMLSREEVPGNFYQNASHMHNTMVRLTGRGEEIMIDAFADFPKVNSDPSKNQDNQFLRNPRTAQSRDQLDTRKDQKNLTQG